MSLVINKFLLPALILTGCSTTAPPPSSKPNTLKLCAQALVVLDASADCTALSPNICMFTMSDLLLAHSAAADKQNYCPRLEPGQEEGNN